MNRSSLPYDIRAHEPDAALQSLDAAAEKPRMNQVEVSLINSIVADDRDAMARLYEIYHPRLYRFLAGMVQDGELIAELINDVMLIVWQKAAQFRGESRVSTWIFGICYRRALDALRKYSRYREVLEEVLPERDFSSELDGALERRDLEVAMRALTPEQRAVAQLTFEFGYSYPEIAEILEIPRNTVKTRMFHARKTMQAALAWREEHR